MLRSTIFTDGLATSKAQGKDGISPEVLEFAKGTLIVELPEILRPCWREGTVLKDMRDTNIVTLYKNKCDKSDCNNYHSIFLLSIVGKTFARVVLKRLLVLAKSLHRVAAAWVQNRQVHCRHGILTQAATGKVQGAEAATLHCLH